MGWVAVPLALLTACSTLAGGFVALRLRHEIATLIALTGGVVVAISSAGAGARRTRASVVRSARAGDPAHRTHSDSHLRRCPERERERCGTVTMLRSGVAPPPRRARTRRGWPPPSAARARSRSDARTSVGPGVGGPRGQRRPATVQAPPSGSPAYTGGFAYPGDGSVISTGGRLRPRRRRRSGTRTRSGRPRQTRHWSRIFGGEITADASGPASAGTGPSGAGGNSTGARVTNLRSRSASRVSVGRGRARRLGPADRSASQAVDSQRPGRRQGVPRRTSPSSTST